MKKLKTIRQLALDLQQGKKLVASLRLAELELLLKLGLPIRAWAERQTIYKP